MPTLNYTTQVTAGKTIGEIQALLACDNEWCDGTMQTISISCGADPGSKDRCDKCGRQVEHGGGPPRVRYEGRRRVYK